ncbi:MAG: aminotransferase class V-fold PLP-dependent enzyme [Caldilineaceae bacterium]
MADVLPTYVGYPSQKGLNSEGQYIPAPGAKRFEMGTVYWPGLAGIHASLTLREEIGNDAIYAQIQQITATCREMLEEVPGLSLVTPERHAGLLSFTIDGVVADEAVGKLAEQKIIIRSVHEPDLLRVSTSFYNDESDALLRDGLESLRTA